VIRKQIALAIIAIFPLVGCTAFPVSGPQTEEIVSHASGVTEFVSDFQYELVSLKEETAEIANATNFTVLSSVFRDRRPAATVVIGVGDVVGVTIYEASAGGLFIPNEAGARAGNFVNLPNQTVDKAGFISVPYAGTIKAAGFTPSQVQAAIVERLLNRAIEPQAVVTVVEQRSQVVAVLGEVNSPARLPVTITGERLLDTIARSGGIRGNGVDLFVRLVRNGRQAEVHFPRLTAESRNNIYTQPGDTIYVYRDPPTFVAFGASGSQGQFGFDLERLTLAEAVAKAGGLLDDRANPGATFLYRRESHITAKRLGVDVRKYPGGWVPIIYNINLRDPRSFFVAQRMTMRSKDVLFVSNAAAIETAKILQFLRIVLATARETNAARLEIR
jgi:polysaccharide export outer membrane protein